MPIIKTTQAQISGEALAHTVQTVPSYQICDCHTKLRPDGLLALRVVNNIVPVGIQLVCMNAIGHN